MILNAVVFSAFAVRRKPWFIFHCGWMFLERLSAFKYKLMVETHPENVSLHPEKGVLNS